jgi:hypothetical protein
MKRLRLRLVQVLLALLAFSTLHHAQATTPKVSPKGQPGVELLRMDIEWASFPQSPLPSVSGSGQASGPARVDGALKDQIDTNAGTEFEWQLSPSDRRLSIVLQRWSAQTGWQLVWEAERDFPVEVRVLLSGTFSDALHEVMNSLSDSDYPLQAVMNGKTKVLRIRHRSGGGL